MAEGDGLQVEDGKWLKVQAAVELIIEVRHKDPDQLVCALLASGKSAFAD
jgi:urease accessory protein UreE